MEQLEEAFDSSFPLKRNEFIEKMANAQGIMIGKRFRNIRAHSTEDNRNHFLTFDHDGAKEIHIFGPNMMPFFTKDHPHPMKVFGTAISLVKPHIDAGGTVRLSANDEPESREFYSRFANRATKMGYNVKYVPTHEGASGGLLKLVAWEISQNKHAPS